MISQLNEKLQKAKAEINSLRKMAASRPPNHILNPSYSQNDSATSSVDYYKKMSL